MLPNPKHELIAKSLSRGASAEEACKMAGLTGINATQANALCKRPDIVARVGELSDRLEKTLNTDIETIEGMEPDDVRKLLTENYLIKELIVSIKLSQTAGQFNATKSLIELLGKEIGMFGGSGNTNDDTTKDKSKESVIINVLQNLNAISDMSEQMIDITPKNKLATKKVALIEENDG